MAYFGYDSLKIIIYSFSKVPFQDYLSIVFSFQSGCSEVRSAYNWDSFVPFLAKHLPLPFFS